MDAELSYSECLHSTLPERLEMPGQAVRFAHKAMFNAHENVRPPPPPRSQRPL